MNTFRYQIKDWHGEDDWVTHTTSCYDLEFVAEEIAKIHYDDDPCNPDEFECVINIKTNQEEYNTYRVFAFPQIDFRARKIEKKEDL